MEIHASAAPNLRPTGVEPVKVTLETLGCETIVYPVSAPLGSKPRRTSFD
ncbi:MAG: hypothetical protein ABJI45_22685 [Paracoccaceae bacterium]